MSVKKYLHIGGWEVESACLISSSFWGVKFSSSNPGTLKKKLTWKCRGRRSQQKLFSGRHTANKIPWVKHVEKTVKILGILGALFKGSLDTVGGEWKDYECAALEWHWQGKPVECEKNLPQYSFVHRNFHKIYLVLKLASEMRGHFITLWAMAQPPVTLVAFQQYQEAIL
jgi:hypothetical protein